ncbi:glycosyltransferase family 4 protein [Chitinispirillales bacterium ANBcel5]|uniref:glycosyltransferase family 4 protein n=1 Tax=Cellulosispirillum alkaliphilum TaxID=3039283 RepID=UPI002A516553|nr:glycosyltransferase family 4 protein [Chitinispirillales bacterium ANBcel5]
MKIAMLAPVAWRTPPRHYGPWELVTSLLTEQLVKMGLDVTLFATQDSLTSARLRSVVKSGYEEDPHSDAKVCESLHIANCFESAEEFDLIHNHFDFLPLCYSKLTKTPLLTTIHGFSSPKILAVYKRYNTSGNYVSISDSDRSEQLNYLKTIYHGIDIDRFTFRKERGKYLIFFGRMHHDKGALEAIKIAQRASMELVMAGPIQDQEYFKTCVAPYIDNKNVHYAGSVGPAERDQLLGEALALLHPINFNEPFGLSVVEAMACGTPTVAFNRGSMPELIEHGKTGFLAQTTEEAARYIDQCISINRVNCRNRAEQRFSVKKMAEQYAEAYTIILEKDAVILEKDAVSMQRGKGEVV